MRFILAAIVLILAGCTNPDSATAILETDGYTNIEMTGYRFFACSEDDFYHTGFRATKNSRTIEGTVCAGFLLKGSTIRFD